MPSEVQFTRAQKWDLVRISAAAVASTVFFTTPIFLVRPDPPPARHGQQAAERQPVVPARSAEPAAPSNAVPKSDTTSASLDEDAVSVVTSTEFASVTMPQLQSNTTTRPHAAKPPQVRARGNSPASPPSLSRRLARFFAGNGKYNVKPFPTVNSSGG